MTIDANTTQETFDRLFNQLLSTLAEENDLRSGAGGPVELVEVRDRLNSIRAELAIARRNFSALAIAPSIPSDNKVPECDCHETAADHAWEGRYWAA